MLDLRRRDRPLRVGHRGAAALAPENTAASLRAAVEHGVDVVEFDVLALPREGLVLAHSAREVPETPVSLDEALSTLASAGVGVQIDVKGGGLEDAVVATLAHHGMTGRAVVSSVRSTVLARFAALEPTLPRALSYPDDRLGVSRTPLAAPAVRAALVAGRATLPYRLDGMLRRARATVASLHEALVTARTVEHCRRLGVPLVVWTVDDPERVRALDALGVDAVVSDDPRMLAATLTG